MKNWAAKAEHRPDIAAILNRGFEIGSHEEHADDFDEMLRAYCADKIEAALPPSPWRDYAIRMLRRPAPPSPWILRRKGASERNFTIFKAVRLAEIKGLKPTRNQAQRYKGGAHSACSLVAEELKRFGIHLGEDAIEKLRRRQQQDTGARQDHETDLDRMIRESFRYRET
jgi:hypothetical protein